MVVVLSKYHRQRLLSIQKTTVHGNFFRARLECNQQTWYIEKHKGDERPMDWVKNLRAMKERNGLTTKEIAQKSGIPEPTLEKLFSGATKEPKLTTLQPLVKCLGFRLDELDTGLMSIPNTPSFPGTEDDPTLQTIIDNYKKLNKDGQQALVLHSILLVQSGMYGKHSNIFPATQKA